MYWIINESIEFRPGMKKLTSINNPEVNVILTTPASRCLLLLLEASPEVVLQQDFFKKVWEEEGMLVPANTLYQNISIVRRGLRAAGDTDQKVIATIPRKGFQIDGSVKIDKQDDLPAPPIVNLHTANDELSMPVYETTSFIGEDEVEEQTAATESEKPLAQDKADLRSWQVFTLVVLIAFIAGLFATHFIWHINDEPAFFDNYKLIETANGCHLHTKDDSHDSNNPYLKYKSLILQTGLNCSNYPWVYFPISLTSPTLTALVCKHAYTTESSPGCISLHINGVNRDD